MRGEMPLMAAIAGLVVTLCAPAGGAWMLDASKTFMAEQRVEPQPCCPRVFAVVEEVETPASVCFYYVNNFKRAQRGRVRLRSEVRGLESLATLGRWRASGRVCDGMWMECRELDSTPEPCLLSFEFALAGFPRMRFGLWRRDGFAVGVFVTSATVEGEARRGRWLWDSWRPALSPVGQAGASEVGR